MKIKVSEATLLQLDWLVAKREGTLPASFDDWTQTWPHYTTDWNQGGPIGEREGIHPTVEYQSDAFGEPLYRIGWRACMWNASTPGTSGFMVWGVGETQLIAIMRCYVTAKLGKEVDVPDELVG